ncbi:hypothetical protein Hanom_Chr13g01240571 [Helianthus anomalus]
MCVNREVQELSSKKDESQAIVVSEQVDPVRKQPTDIFLIICLIQSQKQVRHIILLIHISHHCFCCCWQLMKPKMNGAKSNFGCIIEGKMVNMTTFFGMSLRAFVFWKSMDKVHVWIALHQDEKVSHF